MNTLAEQLATRLLESDEIPPEQPPQQSQPATPKARQVPHPSHEKWTGARKTFDDLWALKQKAMDLYGEMGRSIRYNQALAELGYTREEVRGPVPANIVSSTDNLPANHPGKRWFRSYAQRFPDAVVGAKLEDGSILFFNNPHNPRTGNPDYPTYEEWGAKMTTKAKADSERRSGLGY